MLPNIPSSDTINQLPIFCYFDKQRFTQFGSMDCANWYGIQVGSAKKQQALYPAMGRKHITYFGLNKLIFTEEPKQIFKTINYFYVFVGTSVIQVDQFYNERLIGNFALGANVWFDFLPVGNIVYAMFTDEQRIYVITENGNAVNMVPITDPRAPTSPLYVAAFGNRFVVSKKDTPEFYLSQINLGGAILNPATAFTINGAALFNTASGVIGQFAVLHNQLYILCDYQTDIWSNIPSQLTVAGVTTFFPWKLNTSSNWDFGIFDPFSLSVDFGRIAFLANNRSGLVSFMVSFGQQPQDISSQAVNTLLENSKTDADSDQLSPFLISKSDGFLYQYENTIFYRVSAGPFGNFGILDLEDSAHCIEYNFETQTWSRAVELNGERNRIQKHVYFNNRHLVTVSGDPAIYEMAGNIYRNELRTPNTDPQAVNAFTKYPMRYKLVTPQIYLPDYAEFITDYVEIDFVFGDRTFFRSNAPFLNTIFIITEDAAPDGTPIFQITEDDVLGEPVFIIMEEGNTPGFDDNHYNALFKPHIELYFSDDGGISFDTADLREFSQLGQYQYRMRWYQLGPSRNRCYKLVCISSAPIVILGGVQNIRRASGGAN